MAKSPCAHRYLHPYRFDGSKTVCIECSCIVTIVPTLYAKGISPARQFQEALTYLDDKKRADEKH